MHLPRLLPIALILAAAPALAQSPAETCLEYAGEPDAGVPVSPEHQAAIETSLHMAAEACAAAAEAGDAVGHFHMGALQQLEGEHEQAIASFEAAADGGLAQASTKLGDYRLFGAGDADGAAEYYQVAADLGDPAAQTTLALLHRLGRGVPRDMNRMVELMQQAADGGYHFAQFRLGQTYLTGDGIPGGADESLGIPDAERAAVLFTASAEQGNIEAVLELAKLYGGGEGAISDDPLLEARWTQAAADTGLPQAIAALGFLYERGRGVQADPERAAALYVEALESGDVDFDDMRQAANGRSPGWDRDTAIAFQVILQERGLYRGAIDGVIGAGSRAGARALDD